jgi:2-desacetyl-2-hydroxyethyl bacteriochlorophyllide A dehydrogenase
MRAAYFRGDGVIEHTDVPTPEPGEGQVLIRVAANAVCGSDHKALDHGHKTIPGHEVVGTIVQVGPGCQIEEGARTAAYIPLHCGECTFCQRGAGNLCPHKKGLLGWSTDGGYAEYMLLPERNALVLDDKVSFAEGALLLDTIGTSGHALRLSRCWEAESVLVIGAGPIGIGALAMLKAYGVPNVYVSEPSEYRRCKAAELGATVIDPSAEDLDGRIRADFPYGVDIVFEAAGLWPTILQSLDLVRPGGAINLVGEYWGQIEIDRPKGSWMINDMTLIRSFYFTIPEFYENQQMIVDGKLNAAPLATHTYPLKELRAAYDLFRAGQTLKVLVTPGNGGCTGG